MKVKRRYFAFFLATVLLLTGCKHEPSEEEKFLEAVRAEQTKFNFLGNFYSAVYSLQGIFGMWDANTYQSAKKEAKISKELANELFPSVNWLGNPLTNQSKTAQIREIFVTSCSEEFISAVIQVSVCNNVYNSYRTYYYEVSYSNTSEVIVSLDELLDYKDWG